MDEEVKNKYPIPSIDEIYYIELADMIHNNFIEKYRWRHYIYMSVGVY